MREVTYSNPNRSKGQLIVAKKKAVTDEQPAVAETANETTQPDAPATEGESVSAATAEDPSPADASDGIGDDSPLVEGGELDPERAALKRETDDLRAEIKRLELKLSRVDELDMAIIDAGIEVDELEAAISHLDKERKDLKEDLKKAVATLRACVIRRKTGQKELFTEPQKAGAPIVPPAPVDVGGEAKITALLANEMKKTVGKEEFQAAKDRGEPIGMTEKQIEVIEGFGWDTIAKMEKGMNANAWWHREIKGFGPDKIDRLTITLAAFRRKFPIPSDSTSVVETAVGVVPQQAEPAAEAPAPTPSDPVGEVVTADQAPSWQAAVDRIRNMLGTANDLMHNGPGDCIEFMESVTTQASDVLNWVTTHEHVTAEQETAIDNWAEGIAKWQPAS